MNHQGDHKVVASTRHTTGKTRTFPVRYMFPVLVSGMAAVMLAAVATSQSASYIRLVASESELVAGDRFSVTVSAFAHVPVNAIDITLSYDESRVRVVGIDRGRSVITLWTAEPEVGNGRIRLQGGTYRRGFRDEHQIAVINLEARQSGRAAFLLTDSRFLAGDGVGTEVPVARSSLAQTEVRILTTPSESGAIVDAVEMTLITDLNGDGQVTLADISMFMAAWTNRDVVYDFTGDGRMGFRDFSILLAQYFFGSQ